MKRDRPTARAVQLLGQEAGGRPPAHPTPDAKRWWRLVLERYELQDQPLRLLQLAAEAWDRAAQARRILKRDGLVYRDDHGPPRKHPAVSIEEQARPAFAPLLRELDLEGGPHPRYPRERCHDSDGATSRSMKSRTHW